MECEEEISLNCNKNMQNYFTFLLKGRLNHTKLGVNILNFSNLEIKMRTTPMPESQRAGATVVEPWA